MRATFRACVVSGRGNCAQPATCDDLLLGAEGDDTLHPDTVKDSEVGDDTAEGGPGLDTVVFDAYSSQLPVPVDRRRDGLWPGADILDGVER
jgi:hypothetical protein